MLARADAVGRTGGVAWGDPHNIEVDGYFTSISEAKEPSMRAAELLAGPALVAGDQTVLNPALDAVLLDFKAADAGEIDWPLIGVAARAERVEVLGACPPLEDIDARGIHRIR